jgi:hypothetical protein
VQPDPAAVVAIGDDEWSSLVLLLDTVVQPRLDPVASQDLRDCGPGDRDSRLSELETDYPEQIAEFRRTRWAVPDAGAWVKWLGEAGATVDVYDSWPDFTTKAGNSGNPTGAVLGTYGLVLLDYKFGAPDGGEKSKEIARQIASSSRALAKSGGQVPILARFSAEIVERTEEEILRFLEDVEFPRSAYAVVPKASIRSADWQEPFFREIEKASVGRRLFELTVATQDALLEAIEKETSRLLFRLDAPSVRLLNERALEPEGVAEVEHWMEIIIGLVSACLRESPTIAQATGAMLELMATATRPGLTLDTPALAKIENRLRFDYAVNRLLRPIDFGDVFVFDSAPNRVALLVSQACDMSVRSNGKKPDGTSEPGVPERPRVVLLLGNVVETGLPLKADDGWTTHFSVDLSSSATAAIEWKWDTTVMLPRSVLDLVSLREDGRAVLPTSVVANPRSWTRAYRAYLIGLVAAANARARNRSGRVKKAPLRFDGDDPPGKMPGLGSLAQYRADDRGTTDEPALGLRRIARLRAAETQRIGDHLSYVASRVALATSLRQEQREVTVTLVPLNSQARPDINGTTIKIKGEDKPSIVQVASSRFRELCGVLPGFAELNAEAANGGESFNLRAIDEDPELKAGYTLQPMGNSQYEIREKARVPVEAATIVRGPQGHTRQGAPRVQPE